MMAADRDNNVTGKDGGGFVDGCARKKWRAQTWQQRKGPLTISALLCEMKSQPKRHLPENEVVDFELGLNHARRPQSHSQNIRLRGHIIWRSDAGHVLEKAATWGRRGGRGGGGGARKVKELRGSGEKRVEEETRNSNVSELQRNLRSKEV